MRKLWLIVLVFALVAYVLCAAYSLFVNAEVRFWVSALKKKADWAKAMDVKDGNKLVFAGGSTTLFAIQSKQLYEQTGIQTVNMGMTVSMGVPYLCSLAYDAARPGDTIVLLLEPSLICKGGFEPTALSVQTALRTGGLAKAFGQPLWNTPVDWGLVIGSMRPGAYHTVTAVLKAAYKRPAYRYPEGNVDESGYLSMPGRGDEWGRFGRMESMQLSAEGRRLFQFLQQRCRDKKVTLYYALPWFLCDKNQVEHNRSVHRKLLREIAEVVPVLEDEFMGCLSDDDLFYDQVHLSSSGAAMRTRSILKTLGR